jgi:hypothetical protein
LFPKQVPVIEPRPLPASLKRGIFFSNPLSWFGLLFFLFGGMFFLVFAASSDFTSVFVFSSHNPRAEGRLVAKSATGASTNKRRIYEYAYRYQVDAARLEGRSFDTDNGVAPGDTVTVQYLARDPATSRMEGMGRAPFGLHVALLVAMFPLTGAVMLWFAIKRYRQYRDLVQFGVLTTGTVVRKAPTRTKINNQTVYDVFFQFKASDGRLHEACIATHKTDNLGDEEQEPLVYDASRPRQAVLLDALPPAIRRLLTGR